MTGRLLSLVLFAGCLSAYAAALQVISDSNAAITPLDIAEDARGNFWIATEQGVYRFDGKHYFPIESEALFPTTVKFADPDTLLIGARNGLFAYRAGRETRLSPISTYQVVPIGGNLFYVVRQTRCLWAEVAYWDGTRLQFYPQSEPLAIPLRAADGGIWRECPKGACEARYSAEMLDAARSGRLGRFLNDTTSRRAVLPTGDGWYARRALYSHVVEIAKPGQAPRSIPIGRFTVAGKWVPSLYRDKSGRVWIPGDSLWVATAGTAKKFAPPELGNRRVNIVFQDSRGRIWFGLKDYGLALLGGPANFESWTSPATDGEINALAQAGPRTIVAASILGAIYCKDGEGPWKTIGGRPGQPLISQIAARPDGSLVGMIRVGLPVLLSKEGRVQKQLPLSPHTELAALRRLVTGPNGDIFVGGQERLPLGFYKIQGERSRSIALPAGGDLAIAAVQDIVFAADGNIYAAFEQGVCRIEGDRCSPFISLSDGLLSRRVRSVGVGPPDEFWVAYRNVKAFSRFRKQNGKWTVRHFSAEEGYESPNTNFLRRDRRGWIWRGTSDGVWISDGLHVEPGDWIRLGKQEGLPADPVSRFGFLEDSTDGSIWIGTESGIAHIRPAPDWFSPNGTLLSGIKYGTKTYAERPRFPVAFDPPDRLAAQFTATSMLPARYRLLPLQTDWQTTRRAEAVYGHLPAGNYRLQVSVGSSGPIDEYAFEVNDAAATRTKAATWAGFGLLGLGAFIGTQRLRRSKKDLARRVLPDLRELRAAALIPEAHALIGTTLDRRFTVHRLLARGGFATVFEGSDSQLHCRCAIKVFHREVADQGLARRFQQEVAALETIDHPNVVRIYGHGVTPTKVPYLVMEYIAGSTLREALSDGPLPLVQVASLVRQAGSALAHMHAKHIYHRDLKPDNLMLRGESLMLIDFSIAMVKSPDQTMHGLSRAAGTLQYMAPEQALGHAEPATDIYSLAKVFVEMITGQRLSELLPDAAMNLPVRILEVVTQFPCTLSPESIRLLASALEFDPARRPADARAFAETLAADLDRPD